MSRKSSRDVVRRWEGNPAITAEDIPFPCNTVFNAGADTSICVGMVRLEELMQFCAIGPDSGH